MKTWALALGVGLVCIGANVGCGGEGTTSTGPPTFERLAQRPLHLPSFQLRPGFSQGVPGRCFSKVAVGAISLPGIPGEAALGPWPGEDMLKQGPIYVSDLEVPRIAGLSPLPLTNGGTASGIQTLWLSRASYDGPLLVRGGRLDAPGKLGFGLDAKPAPELRLPSRPWPRRGLTLHGDLRTNYGPHPVHTPKGWRAAMVPTRIQEPGCYGFQVDGFGFSYVLAIAVQQF